MCTFSICVCAHVSLCVVAPSNASEYNLCLALGCGKKLLAIRSERRRRPSVYISSDELMCILASMRYFVVVNGKRLWLIWRWLVCPCIISTAAAAESILAPISRRPPRTYKSDDVSLPSVCRGGRRAAHIDDTYALYVSK